MNWEENLKTRTKKTLNDGLGENHPNIILQSPFDFGVIRNGGRRGAKHAPQALLSPFLKMTVHESLNLTLHPALELSSETNFLEEFDSFQAKETEYFKGLLPKNLESLLHLGGGHDHIYPLASALLKGSQNLVILNVDAHLDTREDSLHHSGTPFRQIFQEFSDRLHLYQVGIHPFANGKGNYEEMGNMTIIDHDDWEDILKPHQKKGDLLLLSLDCDGLDASFMPAVSAPNHQGLSQKQYLKIMKSCFKYWEKTKTPRLYGVYEYNPLFDDLAGRSARYLASTFYKFFN